MLRTMDADPVQSWDDLMGPTVQLWGATTVGSGILLPSRRAKDGEGWRTYVLTAWHVVRDIRHEDENAPISTTLYRRSGAKRFETSSLVAWDADLDLALLVLDLDDRLPFGARLPRREELEAIQVFRPVYAVGCPLGNDPIPTLGEVVDLHHHVDGQRYWMISAPTYVGNSGGGVYDAENHELLGVFTKIYTHGTLRPIVVPHMGLATPLEEAYDWLDSVGHGDLIAPPAAAPSVASTGR